MHEAQLEHLIRKKIAYEVSDHEGEQGKYPVFPAQRKFVLRDLSRLIRITDAASKVVWTDYPLSEFEMS